MKKQTREEFVAAWSGASLGALQAACKDLGHTLRATKKLDAVDEAWEVYAGVQAAQAAPAKAPATGLEYEGRCVGQRTQFCRGGYRFTRAWVKLDPRPSEAQLASLHAEPAVQVRVLV